MQVEKNDKKWGTSWKYSHRIIHQEFIKIINVSNK